MEERKRKECIHYYLCSLRIAEQGMCLPECKKFIDKERLKDDRKEDNNRDRTV